MEQWDIIAHLNISLQPIAISYGVYGYESVEFSIPYEIGEDLVVISTPITGDSIIDAAYKMLCWCAENGCLNKT